MVKFTDDTNCFIFSGLIWPPNNPSLCPSKIFATHFSSSFPFATCKSKDADLHTQICMYACMYICIYTCTHTNTHPIYFYMLIYWHLQKISLPHSYLSVLVGSPCLLWKLSLSLLPTWLFFLFFNYSHLYCKWFPNLSFSTLQAVHGCHKSWLLFLLTYSLITCFHISALKLHTWWRTIISAFGELSPFCFSKSEVKLQYLSQK